MMDSSTASAALFMNCYFGAFLLFVALLVPFGWSQSAADLAQKFSHHEVYEIEPGVVMSAKFAPNGLVCEMHVEQTHFNKDVVLLWDGLDMDGVNSLLDRLVPPSERGEKEQDEFSLIAVSGPTMTRTDRYENVVVEVMWASKLTRSPSLRLPVRCSKSSGEIGPAISSRTTFITLKVRL